jgi:hypothetical protein
MEDTETMLRRIQLMEVQINELSKIKQDYIRLKEEFDKLKRDKNV